jgi:hypothetical protein
VTANNTTIMVADAPLTATAALPVTIPEVIAGVPFQTGAPNPLLNPVDPTFINASGTVGSSTVNGFTPTAGYTGTIPLSGGMLIGSQKVSYTFSGGVVSFTKPLGSAPSSGTAWSTAVMIPDLVTFTDADPTALASDYSATINWGDGTTTAFITYGHGITSAVVGGVTNYYVDGTHTYNALALKTYYVTVTITDVGGSHATVHTSIVDPPAASANDAALMSLMGVSDNGPAESKALDPAAVDLLYGQG